MECLHMTHTTTPNSLSNPTVQSGRVVFESPPDMTVHPFLDSIPMMSEDEFARLVWSIKKHGLSVPISLDRTGVLLDGRCRLMACRSAGVEPQFRTIDTDGGEDAVEYIVAENFQRTHLTPSEVALKDALLEDVFRDDPDCPIKVLPEARLVARHRDLVELVWKGMSLSEAHQRALERHRVAEAAAERAKRLDDLRKQDPYLAIRVDEGELTVAEGVAAAELKANAPVLAEHAEAIRDAGKRPIADIIEIGRRLTECQKMLGHGHWLEWLNREFGWSDRTALNYMRVYDLSGKSETVADLTLPISGLYLLAAPSTPDAARDTIIGRAEAGEVLSVADVRRAIDQARGRPSNEPGGRLQMLRDLSERMSHARPDDPLVAELRRLLISGGGS
jgi:ParB-like chromosome segregation protein Spo0J